MQATKGRYVFNNTTWETATNNKRFMAVFKSLEQSGGVDWEAEEVNGDLVLTFTKELGCNPPSKIQYTRPVNLPAPLTLERCNKELAAALRARQHLMQSRLNWSGSYIGDRDYLLEARKRQWYVGWWIARYRNGKDVDYTLLQAAGITDTKKRYPCKHRQTFVEYLRSLVKHKPYLPGHDPLVNPVNLEGFIRTKADVEYWTEMVRLASLKEQKKIAA